ncbi:MAG: hypothetical protein HS104_12660 [Polyangiaceae bacterium]|nr:hypothetical protein [Polyangiaceae bacterium]
MTSDKKLQRPQANGNVDPWLVAAANAGLTPTGTAQLALSRALVAWHRAALNGDQMARAIEVALAGIDQAVLRGDIEALDAKGGPVRWARRYLGEHVGLHPYVTRAELARRFVARAAAALEDHRAELDTETVSKAVALELGMLLWQGVGAGLVPKCGDQVETFLRIAEAIRAAAKRRLDGKGLAVAALKGWGLTGIQARSLLQDKDV